MRKTDLRYYNWEFSDMMKQKRNWKEVNDQRILKIYQELIDEIPNAEKFGNVKITQPPTLYFYSNTTRAVGTYYWHAIPQSKVVFGAIAIVDFATQMSDNFCRELLAHELAHALALGYEHDYTWELIANRLLSKWNMTVNDHVVDLEVKQILKERREQRAKSPYKYEIFCSHCGQVLERYKTFCKKVSRANRYYHTKDKGVCAYRLIEE